MRIAIIVEGETERVFLPPLRDFLQSHLAGNMPRFNPVKQHGQLPTEKKLKRLVDTLLNTPRTDYVIALTDVYTGKLPPLFANADDAKRKMREWVGPEPRFYPHAAQYDFEAWLIPYWSYIQEMAQHNQAAPHGNPEEINHGKPPAYRIKEIFERGKCRDSYVKPRDAKRILDDKGLSLTVEQCAELKALVNTIIALSGGIPIP